MKSNSEIVAFILLIGYSYSIMTAYVFRTKANKKVIVPAYLRRDTGFKDIKTLLRTVRSAREQ